MAGQCWIVGPDPTGAWTGCANALAGWTSGGWRFAGARAGMAVWDLENGYWRHFDGTAWSDGGLPVEAIRVGGVQVVGARLAAIAGPTGGSSADPESRLTISQILNALRMHGLIDA